MAVPEPPDAERRWIDWLLLDGDRLHVAVGGSMIPLVTFALLELAGVVPLQRSGGLSYLFGGFVSGNLTLVTVVVSINQLLLSQELQTPGELRSQIEHVIEYRNEVEDAAGRIAPVEPLAFLRLLVENTRQEAQCLGGLTFDGTPQAAREEIEELVDNVTEHMDHVDDLLKRSGTGTFDVLSVTLATNYARQINRIRQLRSAHGEELPEPVMDSLDRLVDRFQDVDVARQYFKSIYLQDELSSLSRVLLYAGGLAEVVAGAVLLSFTASNGSPLPRPVLLVVLLVAVAVCFLPVALLASFVLRIATVTKRTVATLPFTTPGRRSEIDRAPSGWPGASRESR
ncbi:hypothetical protein HUG10_11490 [Halorarum halophilum]|uniref:Uncharacterized protein n=1 Tax=Halorarum halophilum TaxID=2743090 RepID=A0A7D5H303_9EURY|nr:hypothetical protein HUG10_11490 [Halobaculum halophilum]